MSANGEQRGPLTAPDAAAAMSCRRPGSVVHSEPSPSLSLASTGGGQRARVIAPPPARYGRGQRGDDDATPDHLAIDVYAMTNPALCGLVLTAFVAGVGEAGRRSTAYARAVDADARSERARADRGDRDSVAGHVGFGLLYLPVPIVLSRPDLARFRGTNRSTGLFSWIARNPEVVVGLPARVAATVTYTRDGLLFAGRFGLVRWAEDGRAFATPAGRAAIRRAAQQPAAREPARAAERLGMWVGDVGTETSVLHAFGVTFRMSASAPGQPPL